MKLLNKAVVFAFAFSAVSGVAFAADQSDKSMSGGSTGSSSGSSSMGGTASGDTANTTSFSAVDKDGNGYIDANEAAGVPGLDVNTADTDHDGRISRSEFEAAMKSGAATGGGLGTSGESNRMRGEGTSGAGGAAGSPGGAAGGAGGSR